MIARIKEIIQTYELKKAKIRLGIILGLGLIALIILDFQSSLLAMGNAAGIIYGIRVIKEAPRFTYRNNYYEGYWSTDGWLFDMLGFGFSLVLPFMIAFCVGWFLMLVEVVQTIIYYVKNSKTKQMEEAMNEWYEAEEEIQC